MFCVYNPAPPDAHPLRPMSGSCGIKIDPREWPITIPVQYLDVALVLLVLQAATRILITINQCSRLWLAKLAWMFQAVMAPASLSAASACVIDMSLAQSLISKLKLRAWVVQASTEHVLNNVQRAWFVNALSVQLMA